MENSSFIDDYIKWRNYQWYYLSQLDYVKFSDAKMKADYFKELSGLGAK